MSRKKLFNAIVLTLIVQFDVNPGTNNSGNNEQELDTLNDILEERRQNHVFILILKERNSHTDHDQSQA